jgi:hypothetical protein
MIHAWVGIPGMNASLLVCISTGGVNLCYSNVLCSPPTLRAESYESYYRKAGRMISITLCGQLFRTAHWQACA